MSVQVPIGREARSRAPQLGIFRPAGSEPGPAPPPFSRQLLRLDGVPHELAVWLPGPHPASAHWWEDLSVWYDLRPAVVARAAPGVRSTNHVKA